MTQDEDYYDGLGSSDIHFRDQWQFELKSDFLPHDPDKDTKYEQEFYLFIPNALQINSSNYTQKQFYRDQTNLIRYKTPIFSLSELNDLTFTLNPFHHILFEVKKEHNPQAIKNIQREVKLLGNIIRSALRTRTEILTGRVEKAKDDTEHGKVAGQIIVFLEEIETLRDTRSEVRTIVFSSFEDTAFKKHYEYAEQFIDQSIEYYLTALLEKIRGSQSPSYGLADQNICRLLKQLVDLTPIQKPKTEKEKENILYQKSLLKKFVLDALLLSINRFSLEQKYSNIIGGFAAGISMLIYFTLFVWQGGVFVINSIPFIIITVVLYILKDRLKEILKDISYLKATKWHSDYTTEIRSPDERNVLGKLKESFSFVRESELSHEISRIRNREFHYVFESFKRPETILYYKKTMTMFARPRHASARKHMLNIIFRFNISQFLQKASDPTQSFLSLNPEDNQIESTTLPKVYHLNIIMRTTSYEKAKPKVEIKKYRLVINKNGIKRVEDLN